MIDCPACKAAIAATLDETVAKDFTANSKIADRLKTAAENAAKPYLEKLAALTTELQTVKGAAEKLPEVQARLDKLLEADAFRAAGLGEGADVDVLKLMHNKAIASKPEAERPDFLTWIADEKGAKADPATAPLLAAWAKAPAAAAPPNGAPPAKPGATATQPIAAQPKPQPNVTAATVSNPGPAKRPSQAELQRMAADMGAEYARRKAQDPVAAAAWHDAETAKWEQLNALPAE